MDRAKSISVDELTKRAAAAAEAVALDKLQSLGADAVSVAMFPDHGPVGLWIKDFDMRAASVGDLMDMSNSMVEKMGLAGQVAPVFEVGGGGILVGYREMRTLEMQALR